MTTRARRSSRARRRDHTQASDDSERKYAVFNDNALDPRSLAASSSSAAAAVPPAASASAAASAAEAGAASATAVPSLKEVTAFFRNVFVKGQMETECVIMSLIYVERIIKQTRGRLQIKPLNWKSLLFITMIMSSKVFIRPSPLARWSRLARARRARSRRDSPRGVGKTDAQRGAARGVGRRAEGRGARRASEASEGHTPRLERGRARAVPPARVAPGDSDRRSFDRGGVRGGATERPWHGDTLPLEPPTPRVRTRRGVRNRFLIVRSAAGRRFS